MRKIYDVFCLFLDMFDVIMLVVSLFSPYYQKILGPPKIYNDGTFSRDNL